MCEDLHHEQRKYLVLLLDLAGLDWVTVVIIGEHHEASVCTDEEETSNTEHVPPDSSEICLVLSQKLETIHPILGSL